MSAKHTPGPWHACGPTINSGGSDADPCGYALAHILNPYKGAAGSADRVDANARLIAAAPDMLYALQYARNLIGPDSVLDNAIAKATGEQQ